MLILAIGVLAIISGAMALKAVSDGREPEFLKKRTGSANPSTARIIGFIQIALGIALILFSTLILPQLMK